jgi:uncharacterized damage-inducible protein DinB
MTPEYLALLLDYHYWARDRMLDAVAALSVEQYERPMGSSFPSVKDTADHVFSAEWIWYERWMGRSPGADQRPALPDLGALRAVWSRKESEVRALLASMEREGLNRVYEYRTLAGVEMRSKFWEMLVHMVNHATYHRGQVVTMIRQLGAPSPAATDMIAYFRQRAT